MRTFIAIELPQNIKDTLGRLQGKLKQCGADVRWVEPHNIHLTLKFLGEVEDSKLDGINQIIEDTVKNRLKFEITLTDLGVFPDINHPRIIWVGIKDKNNETKLIAEELGEKLEKLGIPREERQFLGHITIGRIKSWLNKDKLAERLSVLKDESSNEKINFIADKITLFKSSLKPNGPIYEVLKEVTLITT